MAHVVKRGARALLGFVVAFGTALGLHAAPALTYPAKAFDRAIPKSMEKSERAVKRAKTVKVDRSNLDTARDSLVSTGAAQMLRLELFDGEMVTLALTGTDSNFNGSTAFRGHVVGKPFSSVAMAQVGDILAANIVAPGFVYQVRYAGDGLHEVREIDQAQFDDHGGLKPIAVNLPASKSTPVPQKDAADTIDVMVAYTATSRAAVGGTAAMNALVALGITETNDAYAASGVIQRLRLVHAMEVAYPESGDAAVDLARLQNTADSQLGVLHTYRDLYGADFVSLWVENAGAGTCGIGYMMSTVSAAFDDFAFNVVARSCATGVYSFGHELGHNMGLRHDVAVDPAATPFSYAHGYVDLPHLFRTVMAYNNACSPSFCTRIQGFSNLTLLYSGFPMGNATADNATVLNATAPTTANFRQAVASAVGFIDDVERTVDESAGTITLTVHRIGTTTTAASVNWATASGTATAGADFTAASGTLSWGVGDAAAKTFSVTVGQDGLIEGLETFTVTLSAPVNTTVGAAGASATIRIRDDEPGVFPPSCAVPAGYVQSAGANASWAPATDDASEGTCSLKSGAITHGQTAAIEQAATFAAGTLSFKYKVSSESFWDCFRFSIDGTFQSLGGTCTTAPGTSGEAGWNTFTTALSAGAHTLKWVYVKDGVDSAGDDAAWIDDVKFFVNTTTALSASAATSDPGTPVTFTATVTGGTPTGTVAFKDGGVNIFGCSLTTVTAGTAACTTSALISGARSITAVYSGDSAHGTSTSSVLTHTVNAAPTTTTLSATGTTSVYGQVFAFTATVAATVNGTPTGTVTFKDAGVAIAGCTSMSLGSGAATCMVGTLAAGGHSITAEYAGSTMHVASTSAARAHTVTQASTTTTLSAPATSSNFGASITFTATVAASPTPTGTVTFKDGGVTIGTCSAVTLSAGAASCALTTLAAGAHTITAEYNGTANYATSVSAARAHTVNAASTTTAVSASATSSAFGAAFTFTATVTSTGGTVAGTVTFQDGGVDIAGCVGVALAGSPGATTCTVSTLTPGSHSITAVYAGNTSFSGSTSATRSHTINAAATTTTLTGAVTTSVFGDAVSFTATVTSAGGTPTGSVTFKDTGTAITGCIALPLTAGAATCTTSGLVAGNRSITAEYAATTSFAFSASTARSHTVTAAASTTVLTSDAAATTFGQLVVFTATVTSPGGTPTGNVAFKDGATTIATCSVRPLTTGAATCSISSLAVGAHTMTATYAGTTAFATSTSGSLAHTVTAASTTTTLNAAISSTTFGQSVTFVATITSTGGSPTGTVAFRSGGVNISGCATVSISSGTASCTTTVLAVGSHTISALYAGNASFTGSTSADRAHDVTQASTSVNINGPGVSSTFGQSFAFTATVSSSGGIPTGTVVFKDAGVTIGSCSAVALSSGSATCSISTLAVGAHSITAEYLGSASFTGSTSGARAHTVNQAPTTTAVTNAVPSSPSGFGSTVTFTATVTSTGGTPTGTVTFQADGVDIPACVARPMTSGAATCAIATLALGAHTITAAYSGATSFAASASVVRNHTVNPAVTATAVSQSGATSTFGQAVTFTATVTSAGGTPPGTVAFKDGGTDIPACAAQPLNGSGLATCVISTLGLGAHIVTASYIASTNFAASNSTTVTHTVNGTPTTTTLTAPATSSVYGVAFTFTATVTSGSGTPTGTVTFRDAGISIPGCSAMPMDGAGVATCTTSALTGGSHSIVGAYSGGGNFAASNSAARTHTITTAPTVTTLVVSAPTSAFGEAVTFTATVTSTSGTPNGSVTFRDGVATIAGCGGVALNASGVAVCTTSALAGGAHPGINAVYSGSSSFATSTSGNVAHTVSNTATTTTVTSNVATTAAGSPVTFTATISPAPTGTPAGTVAFRYGATTITACTFQAHDAAGVATCTVSNLPTGVHTITAVYAGNASHGGSTSPGLTHTVAGPAATTTSLTANPAGTSTAGQAVLLTATVSTAAGTPTGTVAFRAEGVAITGCAAVNLVAGVATCNTSSLAVGARTLSAVYGGSASYLTSTSANLPHTVNAVGAAASTTTLAVNPAASTLGQLVTLTATVASGAGTPTGTVAFRADGANISGCATAALASGVATCATTSLAVGTRSLTAHYAGNAMHQASASTARSFVVSAAPAGGVTSSVSVLDFGGQSMSTTSPAQTITLVNGSGGAVTFGALAAPAEFVITSNNCTTLGVGASCQVGVAFRPVTQGAVSAVLSIPYGGGGPIAVTLNGVGEFSLVTHYYRSILRRAPDAGGKAYWEGEAARVAALGANVNETWYALATTFFVSAEYTAFNRDDTGFLTDLYTTFFNRAPDAGGLAYWSSQIAGGMPREVVLVGFMFSPEFTAFTQAIFGNTAARAEVDTVVDFYRGLLSRLPDSGGFNYWVGQFRAAQCSGPAAVYTQVESISSAYANSPEYAARNRSNAQFVGDMYNAFLRRGGDLGGVNYWIGQLNSGARTRENVRQAFITTPEFGARVQAIINQGCL